MRSCSDVGELDVRDQTSLAEDLATCAKKREGLCRNFSIFANFDRLVRKDVLVDLIT